MKYLVNGATWSSNICNYGPCQETDFGTFRRNGGGESERILDASLFNISKRVLTALSINSTLKPLAFTLQLMLAKFSGVIEHM